MRILKHLTILAALLITAINFEFLPYLDSGKNKASFAGVLSLNNAYAADVISFSDLYGKVSVLGVEFSDKLKSLNGKQVTIKGFMAPPLKPSVEFFVLTQRPMSICPFCSSDADWPMDIIVVKVSKSVTALPYDRPISVTGVLELGTAVDEETGFVSLIRIKAEEIES